MEIFIADDGVDASGRGSESAPYLTLKYVHDHVMQPGDVIQIRAGTYAQAMVGWNWEVSGTEDRSIIIQGYDKEKPLLHNGVLKTWTTHDPDGISSQTYYTFVQVGLSPSNIAIVPTDSRPCTFLASISHFTNPSSVGLTDGSGHLLYDVVFYDSGTSTFYFKPAYGHAVIPNTDLWVALDQFSFSNASFVQFRNLKFKYFTSVHQQGNSTTNSMVFADNIFIGGGIVNGGKCDDCIYDSNIFDLVAPAFDRWDGTSYGSTNLAWCLYLSSGNRLQVTKNVMSRNRCGGPMQCYTEGKDFYVAGNICYDCQYTSIMTGSGWKWIENIMISRNAPQNVQVYAGHSSNFNFSNNYSEGFGGFVFSSYHLADLTPITVAEDFQITDNIFNANWGGINTLPVQLDLSGQLGCQSSLVDRNLYMGISMLSGYAKWSISFTPDTAKLGNTDYRSSFSSYRTGLQAKTYCTTWEANSSSSTNSTSFDFTAGNAVIDAAISSDSIDDIFDYFRAYVNNIQTSVGTTHGPTYVAPQARIITPIFWSDLTSDEALLITSDDISFFRAERIRITSGFLVCSSRNNKQRIVPGVSARLFSIFKHLCVMSDKNRHKILHIGKVAPDVASLVADMVTLNSLPNVDPQQFQYRSTNGYLQVEGVDASDDFLVTGSVTGDSAYALYIDPVQEEKLILSTVDNEYSIL